VKGEKCPQSVANPSTDLGLYNSCRGFPINNLPLVLKYPVYVVTKDYFFIDRSIEYLVDSSPIRSRIILLV